MSTTDKEQLLAPIYEVTEQNVSDLEHAALSFYHSIEEGFSTSLSSHQLPLAIQDRSLSGVIDPKKTIITNKRNNWEVTYKAASVINPKTEETEYYFPSSFSMVILDSIWELIQDELCYLSQEGNSFTVTFRKQDLRKHLAKIGKSRSGSQLNKELTILQGAVLNVTSLRGNISSNKRTEKSMRLSGTYLQSAYEIESDDPHFDGLYRATLHPIIALDLMDGRYRNIAHKYSKGTRETNEVYKTLLHLMSHQFTNADSKQEIISFNIWLDDILFSAGRIESITVDSKRREINKLRKKMFEADSIV